MPINMDYCLLQYDALKFFLVVRLHGRSVYKFNFFNVSPQIWQQNRNVHYSNCPDKNFHNISDIEARFLIGFEIVFFDIFTCICAYNTKLIYIYIYIET